MGYEYEAAQGDCDCCRILIFGLYDFWGWQPLGTDSIPDAVNPENDILVRTPSAWGSEMQRWPETGGGVILNGPVDRDNGDSSYTAIGPPPGSVGLFIHAEFSSEWQAETYYTLAAYSEKEVVFAFRHAIDSGSESGITRPGAGPSVRTELSMFTEGAGAEDNTLVREEWTMNLSGNDPAAVVGTTNAYIAFRGGSYSSVANSEAGPLFDFVGRATLIENNGDAYAGRNERHDRE